MDTRVITKGGNHRTANVSSVTRVAVPVMIAVLSGVIKQQMGDAEVAAPLQPKDTVPADRFIGIEMIHDFESGS
jgi:hypothetical protein